MVVFRATKEVQALEERHTAVMSRFCDAPLVLLDWTLFGG